MRKAWLILLLISLVAVAGYYYLRYSAQNKRLERYYYNQFTGQWEQTSQINPDMPERSTVIRTDNIDGLNNRSIIKGYFNHYDETSQTLLMRAAIEFTQGSLFEPAELKLALNQSIYCVPEHYTDPNTGKSYSLKSLRIPVKDGVTLFVPGEKTISFIDFLERSTEITFLLVQLTADFAPNQTNYVQKIIVTGICD